MADIKIHQEHNLKKMTDANLEKLAKELGLNLLVAENGKDQVVAEILKKEAELVAEEGTNPPADKKNANEQETQSTEDLEEENEEAKRAVIIFPEIDEEDERTSEVRLTHNGKTIRIKRGHEVSISMGHYECLRRAVETRYIPRRNKKDGEPSTIEKEVPRFPHQFIRFEY